MALWRDPLDELIGDLERAIPPPSLIAGDSDLRLEELQFCVGVILWGSDQAKASLDSDPRYLRVLAHLTSGTSRRDH